MENKLKEKKLSFRQFLVGLSVIFSLLCIIGWIHVEKLVADFESTLQIEVFQPPTIHQEEATLLTGEEGDFFLDLAKEVAESYAKFTSADLEFSEIKDYFQEGSEILDLLETYNSNRYNNHEDSYFEDILVSPPELSEECVVKCKISFDYIVKTNETTHNYPTTYTIYFSRETKKVISLEMA